MTNTRKEGKLALPNPIYNVIDQVITLGIPGLGAFYASLAGIWGLPYAEQVLGTLAAVGVILGIIVKISKASYQGSVKQIDGDVELMIDDGGTELGRLAFDLSPEEIAGKSLITLKVNTQNSSSQ